MYLSDLALFVRMEFLLNAPNLPDLLRRQKNAMALNQQPHENQRSRVVWK